MIHNLLILIEVILLFNLLILVHELGHFLAARWRGLYVDRFGIWFGKPIWQKKVGDVTYSIGCIPAGGFVSIPQMAPMEIIEGKIENEKLKELPPAPPLDKIIVAAAGPLFSFLLAFVFACIIYFVGRPTSESETTTTVGYVIPESPAAKAGIQPGDQIQKIDGHAVHRFRGAGASITWRIISSENETLTIDLLRQGQPLTLQVTPERHSTQFWERRGLRYIGISPAISL
ncbi:MAG: M50 family metallopeptidase, partial [Methylacidiphilales bacterium]|nr:M50 family metallopeptidase [Candidatus Methylacidiphilales bacterium]